MNVYIHFFLVSVLVTSLHWSYAQKLDLRFEHVNSIDGLSQGSVSCIVQDYQGFMWFGTRDGLNRYDGYSMKVYSHNPTDSTSLSNDDIICLFEDSEQNLWVGTSESINFYDRETDKFIRHPEIGDGSVPTIFEDSENDLWVTSGPHIFLWDKNERRFKQQAYTWMGSTIQSFFQDSRNNFWVAMEEGVYIYDKEKQAYIPHFTDGERIIPEPTIRLDGVEEFLEDQNGNFWIATLKEGLVLYDRDQGKIIRSYKHKAGDSGSLAGNTLMSLNTDPEGRIWIGTQNQGLSIFVPEKQEFYNYKSNSLDPYSLSFNTINSIYQDKTGNMWLGTHNAGVNLVSKRKFSHIYANSLDHTGLSDNNVTSFIEDKQGDIWIGTDGGGINIFNREKGEFRQLKHDPDDPHSLSTNVVTYILQDSKDNIWISYWAGGLDKLAPGSEKPVQFRHAENDTTSLFQDNVMYLYEDKRANLWVATLHGLDLFQPATQDFKHINLGVGLDNYVVSMLEDEEENLWIGTWEGLKLLDRATLKVTHLKHDAEKDQSLSENTVYVVFEDSKRRLWIGTAGGLNLLDKGTHTFKHYHVDNGLPSEAIYGIQEDEKGNLWLSTGKGLCRFNPGEETFKNFGVGDGLQDNQFKHHASVKLRSGELIFGGGNGFNLFDPESIKDNRVVPTVVLTDFKVFNESLEIGGPDAILCRALTLTEEITLSHEQSVFSIDFAALNYGSQGQSQYAYKLVGFDQDWVNVGHSRTATYTNLDPGTYTFRVKASNNDGYWNEEGTSLIIVVEPPFWKTGWFRLLVAIFLVGTVAGIIQLRTYTSRKKRRELEYKVMEQTKELRAARNEAIAASKSKSEFLANMSHEIRTPMNGIIGMAELAMEANPNERQKEYLNIIVQSADTLVAIINEILDYSKIEAGKLQLEETPFNLVELVESVLTSFSVKAIEKDVELLCTFSPDVPAFVKADPVRLRQILNNLIGNALKFTSEGEVLVSVETGDAGQEENEIPLSIKVKDTGIGILPEKLKVIFESFSQADASTTRQYGGTGLGLAISQRLVQMMGGEIRVDSQVNAGSTFYFTIKCRAASDKESLANPLIQRDSLEGFHFLVVDDNKTNGILLHDLLTNKGAQVTIAYSGQEGLEKTSSVSYSVILLDHQMPLMDGLEFVEQLRKNGDTSTRIILLSSIAEMAIADAQQAGIDGYLTKPLHRKDLWKVINQVLDKPPKEQESQENQENQGIQEKEEEEEAAEPKNKTTAKKVLLAEDIKANQIVARHMFARFGITLDFADDGKQALDMLKSTRYDVVFMDIQMPHANGYEVTRELRSTEDHINRQVPVIAMTANAMNEHRAKCMDVGMDDYIAKPIKMQKLEKIITKWILTEEEA